MVEQAAVNRKVGGSNPPPGANRKIMKEREIIRLKQAKTVMPLIGELLDSWDDLPNDVKSDPELERLSRNIQKIDSAMEDA